MQCRWLQQRPHECACREWGPRSRSARGGISSAVRSLADGRAPRAASCACGERQADRPDHHDQALAPSVSGRRGVLASLLGGAAAAAVQAPLPASASVSGDLLEGTANWASIGMRSYSVWFQGLVDSISNDDQTGLAAAAGGGGGSEHRRKFGSVVVPGLSSFSFLHGTLVGGALILLLAADRGAPGRAGQEPQAAQQQQPLSLKPEVEAALRRLLASPDTAATFHDPRVEAAMAELRAGEGDLKDRLAKYSGDPAVLQAFEKLLEIEGILERLD